MKRRFLRVIFGGQVYLGGVLTPPPSSVTRRFLGVIWGRQVYLGAVFLNLPLPSVERSFSVCHLEGASIFGVFLHPFPSVRRRFLLVIWGGTYICGVSSLSSLL